jgi:DNA-binding transcriptional LysR family regulator
MEEELLVVAGADHPLTKRRRVSFESLVDHAWILASADNLARSVFEKAFLDRNLAPPQPRVVTYSMQLRMQLLERGQFLTVMPDTAFANGARHWKLRLDAISRTEAVAVAHKRGLIHL